MNPLPNHCVECDKPTMDTLCGRCKEKDMGKVKGILEEDMMKNPELYNNHVDYEFWIQCNKEKMNSKPHKQKGNKNGKIPTR